MQGGELKNIFLAKNNLEDTGDKGKKFDVIQYRRGKGPFNPSIFRINNPEKYEIFSRIFNLAILYTCKYTNSMPGFMGI